MGFGLLKYLPTVKMEQKLVKKLVENFDVGSCSLFGLTITAQHGGEILGFPSKGKLVPKAISDVERDKFKAKYEKLNFKKLTELLKKADLDFTETFMLYAFGHFYCSCTKDVPSQKLYNALSVVPSAREYNWGKFVCESLLEAITIKEEKVKQIAIHGIWILGAAHTF
ncbi:hypothetical protein DCAR_0934794 [Daucus carota subsp. sativus]|uniref:Uncharacterized protein n=1 Tax=Daucus carota subsp. sativus TaxID=79200 RepID=A0A175Y9H7_DAUCS|nr:hypothetical protein DCAR_0934794 [Daucus carota subsp. sativus]